MPHGQACIEMETLNAYDAVDIIKAAGGIPVIAHPKSIGDDEAVVSLIQYGVEGLEVYHPSHTQEEKLKYKELASERRLYITGGSDWHGKNGTVRSFPANCMKRRQKSLGGRGSRKWTISWSVFRRNILHTSVCNKDPYLVQ